MALKIEFSLVNNFERKYSKTLEIFEGNLKAIATTAFHNNITFAEFKETLRDLEERIQIEKEHEKSLVDDHTKLSETVGAIQTNFTNLSTKISSSGKILSKINETLITRTEALDTFNEMKETIKKQNEIIETLKKKMKTMEKETILLLGGRDESKVVNSLLILENDGENDRNWKELNLKLPYAVDCHGAQFLNNNLYIFGGHNENDETLNLTYKLTRGHKWLTNCLQWEKMADMNQTRMEISNSSVILNNRIWVIGGWNDEEGTLKSVETYDLQTNIWTNMKPMNEFRQNAAAAVVHGKIFCCGGYNRLFLKSAECYDPSSDIWTLISDMPGSNAGCGAVVIDAHLIVVGGRVNQKDYLSSVWVLDTTDKKAKWTEKEPRMSLARCQFSIAKIDNKVFVCGGSYIDKESSKPKCTDDVEIFDGEVWMNDQKLPIAQDCAAVVVIPVEFAKELEQFTAVPAEEEPSRCSVQ